MTATEMTRARSAKIWPDTSFKNIIGKKMTTVVAVEATNADHTCVAPETAALPASSPFSRSRTMFSNTTMAASRTIPVANAKPANEIMFNVLPVMFMIMNPANSEIGMASATTQVARKRRMNHQRIAMANPMPSKRFVRNIAIESPM